MQREIVHKLEDMSIRLADSHAHIDLEDHFPDQAAVLRRAREAGVLLVINVATGLADAPQVIATADLPRDRGGYRGPSPRRRRHD